MLDFLSTLFSIWRTSRNNVLKETVIGWAGSAKRWTVTPVTVHSLNLFVCHFSLNQAIWLRQSLSRSILIKVSIIITTFFSIFDSHFFHFFQLFLLSKRITKLSSKTNALIKVSIIITTFFSIFDSHFFHFFSKKF